jgi:NTE family protein
VSAGETIANDGAPYRSIRRFGGRGAWNISRSDRRRRETRAVSSPGASDPALVEAATPVRSIPTDPPDEQPEPGIALCLSGGGYRAMLFHLGSLWRLNELGWLSRLARVSSVSGGSLTAGVLARRWRELEFDAAGVAERFVDAVAAPIHDLAGETIDVPAGLRGIFLRGSVADRLVKAYERHLVGETTLQDLPDVPRFIFNATNLESGVLWRFSKPYMWDYRVGKIESPREKLAVAIAASAAFPPFLSPLTLSLEQSRYTPGSGTDLEQPEYMTGPTLSDGGVYDNLGLETAWKRYRTILVSDGGGHFTAKAHVSPVWPLQSLRVLGVIDGQVRALRKRQVIGGFKAKLRQGAYWSIWSEVADFDLDDALDCPDAATKELARVPTRLGKLDKVVQRRLVNWGYAICDTAMRKHVVPGTPKPDRLPYPDAGL